MRADNLIDRLTPAARLLIVEDEPLVALGLQQFLAGEDYDICALAASGADALREIAAHKPDVVLMDINLAGDIDGIETIRRIPAEYAPAVIYLTAYSEQATLARAQATKPYGYLLKPFSERELHATIQMVLARRAADIILRESEQRLEALVEKRTGELMYANEKLKKQMAEHHKVHENLGQLTAQIAHDCNNALQSISGALTLLKRRIAQERYDEAEPFINEAIASTGQAAAMTRRLAVFSGKKPLSPPLSPALSPIIEVATGLSAQDLAADPDIENKVVLVVEDDSTVRGLVLEVLQELGYRTLHAKDGVLGLEILRSERPIDLLVTGIGLPGIDGRRLAEGGRALRPDLKVLFMTGDTDDDDAPQAAAVTGMHTMIKPFAMNDLAARIQSMVA